MKRRFPVVLVVCAAIGAADVAFGQSALKELEEKIRQQVRPQPREAVPPPVTAEGVGPVPPDPVPAPEKTAKSGYLGLIADNRKDGRPGAEVLEVAPGGPADRAGLRAGDLITGLGGVKIQQLSEMAAIVQQVPPEGVLEFEILRENRPQTLRVAFGQRSRPAPAEMPAVEPPAPEPPPPQSIESRLERLERRIEQLEQRILLLERRLARPAEGG